KSLVWPVVLALFASEKFEREYGTPEEKGLILPRNDQDSDLCARCGWPLDPDAAGCFACAQGAPPRLEPAPNPALRRPPPWGWLVRGALAGAAVGFLAGVIGIVVNLLAGGGPGVILPGATTLAGGVLGALGVLVWKSVVRPV